MKETETTTPERENPVRGRGEKKFILLVDDDECIREPLGDWLIEIGFDVVKASDGREALNILLCHPREWFAIITDLQMPNATGAELMSALEGSGVIYERMILMTGLPENHPSVEAVTKRHPVTLILKPFDKEHLRECLR